MIADSLKTFSSFSAVHLLMMLAILLTAGGLGGYRRHLRRGDQVGPWIDRVISALALGIWFVSRGIELMPMRFDLGRSLPLHICHVVGLVGCWALLTHRRLPRAVLYYWGIGLSSQAIFQPDLTDGPLALEFWIFWLPHGAIIALAVYDVVGRGFRPAWRDYFVIVATLLLYMAIIVPFNLSYDVDYGYVGNPTGGGTPIDFFGPWPLRLLFVTVATFALLAVMTIPWPIVRKMEERRETEKRPGEPLPTGP